MMLLQHAFYPLYIFKGMFRKILSIFGPIKSWKHFRFFLFHPQNRTDRLHQSISDAVAVNELWKGGFMWFILKNALMCKNIRGQHYILQPNSSPHFLMFTFRYPNSARRNHILYFLKVYAESAPHRFRIHFHECIGNLFGKTI